MHSSMSIAVACVALAIGMPAMRKSRVPRGPQRLW